MGEVINFSRKDTIIATGEARCLSCSHEWTAEEVIDAEWLECPNCHLHQGTFVYPYVPSDPVWTCNCGNDLLFVTKDYVFCPKCGTTQSF